MRSQKQPVRRGFTMNIKELDEENVKDVHQVDGKFEINSTLSIHIENNEITYSIEKIPPYEKRYKTDDVDYRTYIDDPDKMIYLIYVDDTIAGQIILRKNWNNYAYVEDIAVDIKFRNRGIGKTLLSCAKKWAQEKNLAGIMLETQNNNAAACKLYESCGFILGGFDKCLYKGLKPDTDEIALYWYYILEGS